MLKHFGAKLSPTIKYWIFLIGIIAVVFSVIFGSLAAAYLNLSPAEQADFDRISDKLIPFPFLGSIILVAFLCTMVSLLFRYYIIPILRMAEQTRLITAANPDYRITTSGARELTSLAKVINESADAFQKLQSEIDGRVSQSNQAVKEERNQLAALMSELPCGVVVCNREGRIMLYNHKAKEMLQPLETAHEGGGAVGLGRSIYGLLDKAPLAHALAVMNHSFTRDELRPVLGLMTKLCGNRFIRVNMAPVTGDGKELQNISGFVLSLEDITGEINADNEHDRALQGMIDAVQHSLAKLNTGIANLCAVPGNDAQACQRHRQTISQVTNDLEEHLALARELYSQHWRAYGNRENVLSDTLLQLIAKNLYERFAIKVEVRTGDTLWLKIDSYAIVQALTTLAGILKAEYHIAAILLQAEAPPGSLAKLVIKWPDQTVPKQAIRDWQQAPLFMDSDGAPDSPAAIIGKHGGKITKTVSSGPFCNGICVTLPAALDKETAERHSVVGARPISYEFDLFHQPGQEALGSIPLRELTFVAFDTETTGLNPSEGDEIIQLGAVRIMNNRLLYEERIDQLVNPQRPVPRASVVIHGIDPELLPSQPIINQVLMGFHAFAANAVLVAHNAAFDMRFLQLKEATTGLRFDNPVLDTLLLSSVVHPNQEGHSLDAIAERFNITIVGRHTAIGDALATAEVLLKLIPLLEAQGINTLDDALVASSRSPFAKISY